MEFDNLTPLKLIEEVLANIDGAYAVNTLRAYKADMLEFNLYCCGVNACAFPATPQGVARFVQKVTLDGIKSSTVRRKVSSISALHRLGNRVDPTKNAEVALAIRKMHRLLGRHAEQARAVNLPELEDFLKAAGSDLRGQRDCALLLMGYDTLRRRSELVSLQVEDLEFNGDDTGVVLLRKNKTDQDSKGKYLHLSARTCKSLREWIEHSGIQSGSILRGVDRANRVTKSLGEGQISRIYKRLARLAGLEAHAVLNISGHSLRVGAAQDMLKSGASLPQIMVKGGWSKPDTVMRYTEKTRIESRQLL